MENLWTISHLKKSLLEGLKDCRNAGFTSVIFLTGGNTALKLYQDKEFLRIISYFDRVCFADERLVSIKHEDSNAGTFLKWYNNQPNNFEPILDDYNSVRKDYHSTITNYLINSNFKTYCISGFGLDGHFWSLFSKEDCSSKDLILFTNSPNHSHNRITLGYDAFQLLNENYFISTEEKLKHFLKNPKEPVSFIMNSVYLV